MHAASAIKNIPGMFMCQQIAWPSHSFSGAFAKGKYAGHYQEIEGYPPPSSSPGDPADFSMPEARIFAYLGGHTHNFVLKSKMFGHVHMCNIF